MADLASIARPYAKAAFDLASESKQEDNWSNALLKLSAIAQDSDFLATVASPQVSGEQLKDLVLNIAGNDLPSGAENFVALLAENKRLESLPEVQKQYAVLLSESRQSIEAEVVTARALTEAQESKLIEALQSRLGVAVSIKQTIDESLVGGAIVKAGDLVIDGSAKGRLEKLAIALN